MINENDFNARMKSIVVTNIASSSSSNVAIAPTKKLEKSSGQYNEQNKKRFRQL